MKYNNLKVILMCCLLSLFTGCEDDLPKNPVITSPISALEMAVSGIDYTAVPKLNADGTLNDTLFISVRIPNANATVKAIHLKDGLATDIKQGDIITFTQDVFPITLKGKETYTYYIKMNYTDPPILYFVKSSDTDSDGNRYYLDTETAQRLASPSADGNYEGFIDLTTTNWDNICIVASDLKSYYDYNGGWWPEQSSGSFTLSQNSSSGTNYYFASQGPWADWLWTNDNSQIVSPGVWKFNFNISSMELNLLEVQWAISGTAIGASTAMTYDSNSMTWTLNTNLTTGSLRFVSIPVTDGDTALSYGELGSTATTGYIESQGKDINIENTGSYKITLDFSNPPYYSYSIIAN